MIEDVGEFERLLKRHVVTKPMDGSEAQMLVMAPDDDEFVRAMIVFKRVNRINYPNMTDYLWVLKQLGWTKK